MKEGRAESNFGYLDFDVKKKNVLDAESDTP
jgi:hypothetical protein